MKRTLLRLWRRPGTHILWMRLDISPENYRRGWAVTIKKCLHWLLHFVLLFILDKQVQRIIPLSVRDSHQLHFIESQRVSFQWEPKEAEFFNQNWLPPYPLPFSTDVESLFTDALSPSGRKSQDNITMSSEAGTSRIRHNQALSSRSWDQCTRLEQKQDSGGRARPTMYTLVQPIWRKVVVMMYSATKAQRW